MKYLIFGILEDGSEINLSSEFDSQRHCFASATNIAIKLKKGKNPLGIVRVTLRNYEDASIVSNEYEISSWLRVK